MSRLLQNHAGKIFIGIFLAFSAVYFYFINVSISWYVQQYVFYSNYETLIAAFKYPGGISVLISNFCPNFSCSKAAQLLSQSYL